MSKLDPIQMTEANLRQEVRELRSEKRDFENLYEKINLLETQIKELKLTLVGTQKLYIEASNQLEELGKEIERIY